jgi:hypothetical protein
VVYTTNAIESINFQLRKITKTRGHFPSDEAAMKLLYLGRAIFPAREDENREPEHRAGKQLSTPLSSSSQGDSLCDKLTTLFVRGLHGKK